MKKILIAAIILGLYSCEKKDPGIKTYPNNHMEATVSFKSGSQLTINETGNNVTFYKSYLTGGTGVKAVNSRNQAVYIGSGYGYSGSYHTNYLAANDSSYENYALPADTIIYTVTNGNYQEGNFHFTCIYNSLSNPDTVIINGSFKGEYPE